jgi:CO dehydrogenase/acetyl-CoA synthase beta subunit
MPDETPRRRWTDERLDDLADEVRVLRPIPIELGKALVRQEDMKTDLDEFKAALAQAEARLMKKIEDVKTEVTEKVEDVEDRVIRSRRDTLRAVLVFAAPVTAAFVAGAVALITRFG